HAHSQTVRLASHSGHPGGVHAVVDLDLPVAARTVPAHRVDRLGLARDHDAVVRTERALALDEAAPRHARTADRAARDACDEAVEHGVVVAHVANRGHARDDVE